MSDYTVTIQDVVNAITVTEFDGNHVAEGSVSEYTVTVEDIVNAISVAEQQGNKVTVVASTFIGDDGTASKLFYSSGSPSDSVGGVGDFYIDVSIGKLWGPKGASGWSSSELPLIPKRFVFSQGLPSSSWNVDHTLDGFPSVTVVDSAGTVVIGDVIYNSRSNLTINFSAAFSGKAYLT